MVDGRVHRMTELFGRLAPGADLESARAELRAAHGAMLAGASGGLSAKGRLPDRRGPAARSDHVAGENGLARAAGRVRFDLRHRLLERRQPDPGAIGAARRRAGHPRGARRERRRAASNAAGRKPGAVRRRRDSRRDHRPAHGGQFWRATRRASRCARWISRWMRPCCGWAWAWRSCPRSSSRSCPGCPLPTRRTASACRTAASASPQARTVVCACSR